MSASEKVMRVRQCAGCRKGVPMTDLWYQRATNCLRCKRRIHNECVTFVKIPDVSSYGFGYFGDRTEHCRKCAAEIVLAYDGVEVAS